MRGAPVVAVATTAAALCLAVAPSAAADAEADPAISNQISLYLGDDGILQAREEITFQGEVPASFSRDFVLREHYDGDYDRVYEVNRVRAGTEDEAVLATDISHGDDTAEVRIDTAELQGEGGATIVLTYEVHGTTSDIGGATELAWYAVGGYSEPVAETLVVVDAVVPPLALSCAAGDPRSSIYCTSSDMGGSEALFARFTQAQLQPQETLRVAVSYPEDAAEEQLILERRFSFATAFSITPVTLGIFTAVVLTLVGGLAGLIYARRRDERARRRDVALTGPPGLQVDAAVPFRPPDDVHPGQIGTLIDEQADVVDVTATVVDLAVRGYLEIEELPHGRFAAADWTLRRHPSPVADPLRKYEVILLDVLFSGRAEVRLSELGEDLASALPQVRAELYRDMVRLRWFARRPNVVRNRWTTAGILLTLAGVALTFTLALFTKTAFTGLSVIIAGAAITVGAQYMPTKTARGSEVLAHTLGFRAYLENAEPEEVPPDQRVALFSRYLPYAIIFDMVDKWASILASAGSQEPGYDDLPWYHAPDEWRLADFTDSIKTFTRTLSGVISNTRLLDSFTR